MLLVRSPTLQRLMKSDAFFCYLLLLGGLWYSYGILCFFCKILVCYSEQSKFNPGKYKSVSSAKAKLNSGSVKKWSSGFSYIDTVLEFMREDVYSSTISFLLLLLLPCPIDHQRLSMRL